MLVVVDVLRAAGPDALANGFVCLGYLRQIGLAQRDEGRRRGGQRDRACRRAVAVVAVANRQMVDSAAAAIAVGVGDELDADDVAVAVEKSNPYIISAKIAVGFVNKCYAGCS